MEITKVKVEPDSIEEQELVIKLRQQLKEKKESFHMEIRTDDEFLLKILRTRKYNVQRAYDSVFTYYRCIARNQDILLTAVSTRAAKAFKIGYFKALDSGTCKKKSEVAYFEPGLWNPKENFHEVLGAAAFYAEELIAKRNANLNGATIILNLTGFSYQHAFKLTPTEFKRMIYALQDGYPLRIVGIHFINYPAIFWGFYALIKQFMKEKLKKRIHLHSNLESLHSHFCKENLPVAIGGPLEELNDFKDNQAIIKRLEEREYEFKEYYTPQQQN